VRLAHPEHHLNQHALALLGEAPGDQHALLGPVRADREKDGVREQRRDLDAVEAAAPELLKAFPELAADARGGRLGELAEPGLLAQRLDVAHRQPAHERADHHRLERPGAQQLRPPGEQLADERLGRLAHLRDLDRELALGGLHPTRPKAIAQPALVIGPALIARPAQPRVELLLDRALDDQPRPEPGQLRQRLARVLAHPHGQQPVDRLLDLRRRRYRTSHGVGPPSTVSSGLEGTYAVALTAPGDLQHLEDATGSPPTVLPAGEGSSASWLSTNPNLRAREWASIAAVGASAGFGAQRDPFCAVDHVSAPAEYSPPRAG
jgi:hypothetical protein